MSKLLEKWRLPVVAAIGLGIASVGAQEANQEKPEDEPFTIDHVIHPRISAMPTPEFRDTIIGMPMAVSSKSPLAQRHVVQGLAYIQAAWDIEAYRHFAAAVKLDPDCLMAYWGISLALAAPNNEYSAQRMAAVLHMLDLAEALNEEGTAPYFPPMERAYAKALGFLFSSKPGKATLAFRELSKQFPHNLQAKCLAIYLQRDGYTEFGQPLAGQEKAIEEMEDVLNENPNNVSVLSFWTMLHSEAPDAGTHLRQNVLPLVRKMVRADPEFPPYQHLLGHYEWRCGNHSLAEIALKKASALFEAHMKRHKQTFHDCDAWVRCRLYLATALQSRGKAAEAMEVAKALAVTKVEEKRLGSAGANLIVWEARTLPARLYAARGWEGDLDRAIRTLPGKDDPQLFKNRTLSIFYLEGLRQYLNARRELELGNRDKANNYREALSGTGERMLNLQGSAVKSSSISEYLRALRGLEVYTAELRGLVALTGDDVQRRTAFNWFQSAVDKQSRPTLLMPPLVVYPMENRVGDFQLRMGDNRKAAEAYDAALKRRPNDVSSLKGYQESLTRSGHKDAAAQIANQIKLVQAN